MGLPPTHNAWRRITPVSSPQTQDNRARTCIYIRSFIPSKNIKIKEDNNKLPTSVSIELGEGGKLTLKSLYIPPTTFEGINSRNNTLNNNKPQNNPTIIALDCNLHSKIWNPRGYNHVHPQAKHLIRI
ncbi:hypothetical protein O181_011688 [Austropuccinia psidii MF-1]|uniref:Endonuclease/exonuclease/phosphatase domain-containing protein n=1 Tax=Austropuccinia psidii MF-1 TaxID=1389203 RepID=A0A9Q3BVR9_9BASI|nr:hypothetical protein [Austropuccinia psidii MF-1]